MHTVPTYALSLEGPTVGPLVASGNSASWPVVTAFFKAEEQRLFLHIHCEKSTAAVWLLNLGEDKLGIAGASGSIELFPAVSSALATDELGFLTLELRATSGQIALFAAQLPLQKGRTAAFWKRVLRRQRLPAAWLHLLKSELKQLLHPQPPADPRLLEAVQLLDLQKGSLLRIEQLSKAVGMNTTSLKKAFKQYTGTSIFKYQQLKRLQRAANALQQGKEDLNAIAETAGYQNQRHFATAFKKQFGSSPAEFRANQR